MDPVDQFHLPGMPTFTVPSGIRSFMLRSSSSRFPAVAQNIDAYFAELKQAYMYGLLYYFRGVANDQVEKFEKYSMAGKLEEHFRDPRLRVLLMGDAPYWGSSPDRTSYVFDAMLRLSYFLGNYYPKGSSQNLPTTSGRFWFRMAKKWQNPEVRRSDPDSIGKRKVYRCPRQDRFETVNLRGSSSMLRSLYRMRTRCIPIGISSGKSTLAVYGWWSHLRSQKPTFACFLTHIGLRGMDPEKLAEAEGYYWSACETSDIMKNVFKIFVPTHFDPAIAPPGCQILIVQRPSPVCFDEVTDWPAHKEHLKGRTIGRLREVLPGIDDHIVVKCSASAMTSFRFTNNWEGGMLGWEMSPEQLGTNRLPVFTPLDNLYLAGHWTQPEGELLPVIVPAQRVAKIILTGRDEGRDLAANYFAFNARNVEQMQDVHQ